MTGTPGADLFVGCGARVATGIAGHHAAHAAHVLEDALDAPETAAGQHGSLRLGGFGRRGERRSREE